MRSVAILILYKVSGPRHKTAWWWRCRGSFLTGFALLLFLWGFPFSLAFASGCLLQDGISGRVVGVQGGEMVLLDSGLQVRLAGVKAPGFFAERAARSRPSGIWAQEAKRALAGLVLNRTVVLKYGGRRSDRYGRALAHVFLEDGGWVQHEMLTQGMVRFYSFADNRACLAELSAAEREAREAARGLWVLDRYQVRAAHHVARLSRERDTFQLVQGRVTGAALVRGRAWLNFGEDYRTDFTVIIEPGPARLFRQAVGEEDWLSLYRNRDVLVRGWLGFYNGPVIRVTHPEQIEILAGQTEVPE